MQKIVISCASGFKNSGDEAILQAILENINKEQYDITVISFNDEYTNNLHNVKSIPHFDKKNNRWKNAIEECDLFIMGGGGLLQDETTIYNVSFWLKKLKYAIKCKKQTYVIANSIGPINYQLNHNQIIKKLKQVNMISVRDQQSYNYLRDNGIKNIELTADPVFGMKLTQKENLNQLKSRYGISDKYVVISLRHWFDTITLIPVKFCVKFNLKTKSNKMKYENYRASFEKYVRFLNEKYNYQVVFIPMCSNRDEQIAKEILEPISQFSNVNIVDELTPLEIIELIEGSQFILGMRLHSLIYAIRVGKPFVALMYSNKVRGILELSNLLDYGVEINKLSYDQLAEKTELLLSDLESVSEKIDKIGKDFYLQALKNYSFIAKIIKNK